MDERDDLELHARTGDPATSHAAMAAYDRQKMENAAALVVDLHRRYGPMADYQLRTRFAAEWTLCDQSLYRQARNQARNKGLIRDSGQRVVCPETQRRQVVWEACDAPAPLVHRCPTCGKLTRRSTLLPPPPRKRRSLMPPPPVVQPRKRA